MFKFDQNMPEIGLERFLQEDFLTNGDRSARKSLIKYEKCQFDSSGTISRIGGSIWKNKLQKIQFFFQIGSVSTVNTNSSFFGLIFCCKIYFGSNFFLQNLFQPIFLDWLKKRLFFHRYRRFSLQRIFIAFKRSDWVILWY